MTLPTGEELIERLAEPYRNKWIGDQEEMIADLHETIKAALTAIEPGLIGLREEVEQCAERLIEQRDEPWPNRTDSQRLHYWRDKAIEVAKRLSAALNKGGEPI